MKTILYNHIAPRLSNLEKEMVKHIPPGGNWKNIPHNIPSKRLEQIRRSGGRTTYYGRLRYDRPSYTISTYFHRIGNGCYIHPEQDRPISIREAARLQSFSDSFVFYGPKTSVYRQVGNAVPPLLARAVAELLNNHVVSKKFIDLFCGAGGLSEGFIMEGFEPVGSIEMDKHAFETFSCNLKRKNVDPNALFLNKDITRETVRNELIQLGKSREVGVVIGGPPCQGFSLAGWRNPADYRNQLFKYFVDIVNGIKPEFFVLENVPGMLSINNGKFIKEVINSFEKIGYHVNRPLKLKAEEFGVPQKRLRIFIIGSLNKISLKEPQPLFSETEPELPRPVTVKEAIGGLPPLQDGSGSFAMEIDFTPQSKYEEMAAGLITFKEFYESKKNSLITSLASSSITLDSFL